MSWPRVSSVNVGRPKPVDYGSSLERTAIDKRPVDGPVARARPRARGRQVADTRHHGGIYQAVYAYAREDLQLGRSDLGRDRAPGQFGENLTTEGIDLNALRAGREWRIGTARLRVVAVRIPCRTFQGWLGANGFDDRAGSSGSPRGAPRRVPGGGRGGVARGGRPDRVVEHAGARRHGGDDVPRLDDGEPDLLPQAARGRGSVAEGVRPRAGLPAAAYRLLARLQRSGLGLWTNAVLDRP